MERICFYHAGCPDGFGAAWSVHRAWGDEARYIARGHDDDLPLADCRDATVAFVDIAVSNEQLADLADVARRILVLDHHVSARDRFEADPELGRSLEDDGHWIHFDLGHSGAMLAWNHFCEGKEAPDLLRYVQDQDLWTWELPRSREVNAAIGVYEHRFEVWDELAERPASELAAEGDVLVRAQRAQVRRLLRTAAPLALGSLRIEGVNATEHRSRIGHALAERAAYGQPFGCVYRIENDRVHATLYSVGDYDVAKIAVGYGGGGHKNAAGFTLSLADWVRDIA